MLLERKQDELTMATEEKPQEQWSRFVWQSSDIVIIRKGDGSKPAADTEIAPADHTPAQPPDATDDPKQTDKP